MDQVYRIGSEDAGRLVHFEAITSWSPKRTSRLALYRFLLGEKYDLPILSFLILMAQKYAPRNMKPGVLFEGEDGFRIEAPYQVIRLWEVDPAIAFRPGCEALLPWVPLLKGGAVEFGEAVERIGRLADRPHDAPYLVSAMVSDLAVLAGLRYDKDAINHFLERLRRTMTLSTDLFTDSWLYKDGVAEGEAKGRAEGETTALRKSVRAVLTNRFPDLGTLPEIDGIDHPEVLNRLLLAILDSKTADDARAAVEAALRVN